MSLVSTPPRSCLPCRSPASSCSSLAGKRIGNPWAGVIGTATVGGSFVVAVITFAGSAVAIRPGPRREVTMNMFTWISAGPLQVNASVLIDPLSVTMALFMTGVSTLIHLYSIGYMRQDRDYPKFFLYLNLFVFSMLLLVLGGNMLFTFVGWEGVGACSYWLVAFWFERDTAASAGKKAFIYNRIGDVGFLLAMFLIFEKTGSLEYTVDLRPSRVVRSWGRDGGLPAAVPRLRPASRRRSPCSLGSRTPWKARRPVSALIHAATMVTSGVYLLCRMNPLLALSHDSQIVIATIGVATAFVAGDDRLRTERHQEGTRVLDGLAARATCSWRSARGRISLRSS